MRTVHSKRTAASLAALVAALLVLAATAIAGTIVVSPNNASGWTALSSACAGTVTSTQAFVSGPLVPPAGSGSREFRIGDNEDSSESYRQNGYSGTPLAELEALSYWTFVASPPALPPPASAPYVVLAVDKDGDGTWNPDQGQPAQRDEYLVFEPELQGGPVLSGVWQPWNLLNGQWRHGNGAGGTFTLANYRNPAPGGQGNTSAKLINDVEAGGVIVGAGCKNGEQYGGGDFQGTWEGFVGNADAFTIDTAATPDPLYDFEPAAAPEPGEEQPPAPPPAPTPGPPGTADLSIAKTGNPNPATVGGNLTYTVAVANYGPAASTATVEDTLPGNVTFVSASSDRGTCTGTKVVTCDLGEMPRDSAATVRIVVKPTANGTIENSATVTGGTTDSFLGNNSSRVSTTVGDKRAPRVTVQGSRSCELVAERACVLKVKSNEAGSATATGTISFKGPAASARFRFRRVRRALRAGVERELRLRVSRRTRTSIGSALGARRRVRATVRVVVRDRAGNRRTVRRRLRIVG